MERGIDVGSIAFSYGASKRYLHSATPIGSTSVHRIYGCIDPIFACRRKTGCAGHLYLNCRSVNCGAVNMHRDGGALLYPTLQVTANLPPSETRTAT